jgi:adenylate kinase family enzyme
MLQRIHIIGGPGSGKSYAARHLSHRLGIPAHDLDDLFWDRAAERYGVPASEVERDARLAAVTRGDAWIVEGVYCRWLKPSFERADIIFVLRPNVFVRDWRILKRFVSRKFGIVPTKKESVLDLYRLIEWNHKYDGDNLKRAMDLIRDFEHKIVTCRCADDLLISIADHLTIALSGQQKRSRLAFYLCGDAAHANRQACIEQGRAMIKKFLLLAVTISMSGFFGKAVTAQEKAEKRMHLPLRSLCKMTGSRYTKVALSLAIKAVEWRSVPLEWNLL